MDIKTKMADGFKDFQGGLFATVTKADLGMAISDLTEKGASLMCWADPFYPDYVVPKP